MFWLPVLCLVSISHFGRLAATVCPPKQFWNGTLCRTCSGCPLGFGVKTSCTEKEDTECHSCILGFDFSNSTNMEACMSCSEYSNCLEGNAKIVKNCTLVSPHVCQGCADGNFFDKWAGENGGCIECSPPCGFKETESRECTTAHDRQCIKQWKTDIDVVPTGTVSNVKTTTTEKSPIASTSTEQSPSEPEPKQGQASEKESFLKSNWHWVVIISVSIPSVVLGISVLVYRKMRRNEPRKKHNSAVKCLEQAVEQPLLPPHGGLDTLIRDITITDDRRSIAQSLNEKSHDGYFHWQMVAEKLELRKESRGWERAENPAEKLLTAYGEKDGSTIRNFIKALKEVGLTHLAGQLEKKFNKIDEQKKREVTSTSV